MSNDFIDRWPWQWNAERIYKKHLPVNRPPPHPHHQPCWSSCPIYSLSYRKPPAMILHNHRCCAWVIWWAPHPLDGSSCLSHMASLSSSRTWVGMSRDERQHELLGAHLLQIMFTDLLIPHLNQGPGALCVLSRCFANAVFTSMAFFFPFFFLNQGLETAVQWAACF